MVKSQVPDSPQPPPHFPGGEYETDGILGTGGMAVVYRARDLRRPRTVAIKVLRAEVAQAIGTERFLLEIAVTSAFSHPHILPLLDSGELTDAQGRTCPYYVMPLVEGESLRDRIQREARLPLTDAVRLTREILEALRYAHAQGVLHRDIKPANILLSGGHAVVADFGVSRTIKGGGPDGTGDKPLTLSGYVVGTPTYMSPEQALGDKLVDVRADIFAVGCVLYEMVVGVPPFDGATEQSIVTRKVNGSFVPASATRGGVPAALDEILTCALKPEPSDRYSTATDFLNALARVDERSSASGAAPVRTGARRVQPAFVLAALGVVVVAVAAVLIRSGTLDAPPPAAAAIASDKSRVAVMPLELRSPDSALAIAANGLTTDLIDELARFPALTVISKNGVMRFRPTAPADSIARVLNVGSVVTGDMRRTGDSVKVSVRLIEGSSSRQVSSADAVGSLRDMLAVRSSVIDSVTKFLRVAIGKNIRADERYDASNAEAWELLQRVRSMSDELGRSNLLTARQRAAKFAIADSLLALAAKLDPQWAAPVVQRGTNQLVRATIEDVFAFVSGPGQADVAPDAAALRRQAVILANDALSRSKDDAGALLLRGQARFALWRSARPVAPESLRVAAEADLRTVVTRRRDKADAWNDLSTLLQMSGKYAESRSAADSALKADAYLQNAEAVVGRLLFTSLATGRVAEARDWCARGQRQFPADQRFWLCDLTILGWTGSSRTDVGTGWRLLAAAEARDSTHTLTSGRGTFRLLIAAIAARSGLNDSARAIVTEVRSALPSGASSLQADYGEAYVQTLLGRSELAIPLLERYLRANPALRGQLRTHPWFAPLRNDSQFLALTVTR